MRHPTQPGEPHTSQSCSARLVPHHPPSPISSLHLGHLNPTPHIPFTPECELALPCSSMPTDPMFSAPRTPFTLNLHPKYHSPMSSSHSPSTLDSKSPPHFSSPLHHKPQLFLESRFNSPRTSNSASPIDCANSHLEPASSPTPSYYEPDDQPRYDWDDEQPTSSPSPPPSDSPPPLNGYDKPTYTRRVFHPFLDGVYLHSIIV